MSNRIKVTVIIPNYNGLKFMEPCFKALELQIYHKFQILVVDNGSTDGSVEWLKEHQIPTIFWIPIPVFPGRLMWGSGRQRRPMCFC